MARSLMSVTLRIACAAGTLALVSAAHAGKAIRHLALDETAPVVELFDGIESGQLQVRLVAQSAQEASVFIKNKTDAPLTVKTPKAAIGVHVLPQFEALGNQLGNNQFGNQLGNQLGNPFGNQFGNQLGNQLGNQTANGAGNLGNVLNQGLGMGRAQTIGGGMMPMGNNQMFPNQVGNGPNQGPAGMGLFSVPPEKTVQLKMRTVCLNYGHPDPHIGLTYELRKLESVVTDPALCELLQSISPRIDQEALQAAAWRLANGLSWKQLAHLPDPGSLGVATMFDAKTLKTAQALVEQAESQAAKRDEQRDPEPSAEVTKTPKVLSRTRPLK
jgi:hypothetical protein